MLKTKFPCTQSIKHLCSRGHANRTGNRGHGSHWYKGHTGNGGHAGSWGHAGNGESRCNGGHPGNWGHTIVHVHEGEALPTRSQLSIFL